MKCCLCSHAPCWKLAPSLLFGKKKAKGRKKRRREPSLHMPVHWMDSSLALGETLERLRLDFNGDGSFEVLLADTASGVSTARAFGDRVWPRIVGDRDPKSRGEP